MSDEERPDAYASEQRLQQSVKDAVLSVMNRTPEEEAYWSRGLDLIWEYHGTHPIEAAASAWRRGNQRLVAFAVRGAIELQRLSWASRTSRGETIDEHDTVGMSTTDDVEAALDRAVRTYVRREEELKAEHPGQWAVVEGDAVIGIYPSRRWALQGAQQLCEGPHLIHQIGSRGPSAEEMGEHW